MDRIVRRTFVCALVALVVGIGLRPAAAAAALVPPTNLYVSASSTGTISLGWSDTNTAETGYEIERAVAASGPFAKVGAVRRNKVAFTDTELIANHTYFYRVRAKGKHKTFSTYSPVLSARTNGSGGGGGTGPTSPTGLVARATSCRDIAVSWNASTDRSGSGLSGYFINRLHDGSSVLLNFKRAPGTSITDSGIPGTTMTYSVRAVDNSGQYSDSVSTSVTLPLCTNVTATAQRLGGLAHDMATAVAVDGAGNVIVGGWFEGDVDFGGGVLHNNGGDDGFVAKYTPAGAPVWSKRLGGSASNDRVKAIAVDAAGNVVVAGVFAESMNAGGATLTSAGDSDVFLAKYAPDGTHLWSKRFGGTGPDSLAGLALAVGTNGDIALAGTFAGRAGFGGAVFDTGDPVRTDVFLAKYAADGTHRWSRNMHGSTQTLAGGVAIDADGNVAVTGTFLSSADFGGGEVWAHFNGWGASDAFVVKYNLSGAYVWQRILGGYNDDTGIGVAFDGAGNVVSTGSVEGSADLGNGNVQVDTPGDVFVAKYAAANGAYAWARTGGAFGAWDAPAGVAVDHAGAIVVAGSIGGDAVYPATFGGGPLAALGGRDAFVAKYTTNGDHVWSKRLGGDDADFASAIATGPSDRVVVAGGFYGLGDFDGPLLTAAGDSQHLDGFVAHLAP